MFRQVMTDHLQFLVLWLMLCKKHIIQAFSVKEEHSVLARGTRLLHILICQGSLCMSKETSANFALWYNFGCCAAWITLGF
jgi:hypothetical protein